MLETIKGLIDISPNDTDLDDKLKTLISLATSRLKSRLGGIEPPEELDYIIIEVVVSRFNRIGSEGLSSHSTEGESLTFIDDDFSGFAADIQSFLDRQKDTSRGRVRFI